MRLLDRRRELMVIVTNSILPSRYRQVEYVQSDGTQGIATAVIANNTRSIIEFMPITRVGSNRDNYICACWGSASPNRYYACYFNASGNYKFVTANNTSLWTGSSFTSMQNSWHETDYNNSSHQSKLDGVVRATDAGMALSGNTNTIKLFTLGNANQASAARIRKATFEDNDSGSVVGNYIPCVDTQTQEVGYYDLVTQAFYGDTLGGNPLTAGNYVD